jgi:hypothetical protein
MNRFSVWQQVQVIGEEHPRKGQAGVVHGTNPAVPDEVSIKFDNDGVVEAVAVDSVKAL